MVFTEHRLDFFRLGSVGERREPAQIGEDVAYFAAMRRQDRLLARRDDRVGDVRRRAIRDRYGRRGKAGDQSTYPDISAPGENITSSCRVYLPICSTGLWIASL